jgi:hypothetical protein
MLVVPTGRMLRAFCWTVYNVIGVNEMWTELALASIAARLLVNMAPTSLRKGKLGRG